MGDLVHHARGATVSVAGASVLAPLEHYYDAAPRPTAHTEEVGPFTVFVSDRGWPFYARPRLGWESPITVADVRSVLDRQRVLEVPRKMEWVHEVTPSLEPAAREAGLEVQRCPLLLLDDLVAPRAPAETTVRMLAVADPELASVQAAISVGFDNPGTQRGAASSAERDQFAEARGGLTTDTVTHLMSRGLLSVAGAFDETGAVGGGSHSPRGDVTEVTGVAVLPVARRRGLGAAITAALVGDATARGVPTVFCSAESDDVARVYEGIGFRRVGTACIVDTATG